MALAHVCTRSVYFLLVVVSTARLLLWSSVGAQRFLRGTPGPPSTHALPVCFVVAVPRAAPGVHAVTAEFPVQPIGSGLGASPRLPCSICAVLRLVHRWSRFHGVFALSSPRTSSKKSRAAAVVVCPQPRRPREDPVRNPRVVADTTTCRVCSPVELRFRTRTPVRISTRLNLEDFRPRPL